MNYIVLLLPRLILYSLFLLLYKEIPKDYHAYIHFFYFFGLFLYLKYKDRVNISLAEFKKNFKFGRGFWISVAKTVTGFILAFSLSMLLKKIFPFLETKDVKIYAGTMPTILLFGITTMFLAPIVEELYYRKTLILTKNNRIMIITSIISLFLYGAQHAGSLFGTIGFMIVGLPSTISYIKTKNIYVPLTSHLIVNIIVNGMTVISSIIMILN